MKHTVRKLEVTVLAGLDRIVLPLRALIDCPVPMQAGVLGSSLLAMVAPSCVGLAQHARLGNVDWRMAAGLAAGTALGSFAGSKVAVNAATGKPFIHCAWWYYRRCLGMYYTVPVCIAVHNSA